MASLKVLIHRALVRRNRRFIPTLREPDPDVTFVEGPFYSNRAMRRDVGERGHKFGLGPMA